MDTENESANNEESFNFRTLMPQLDPMTTGDEKAFSHKVLARIKKICNDFTPGNGLSCLFVGSDGKGKTIAAEVIAKELGCNVFRIDLSMIVSKYIGETEKNLEMLFARAEDKGWILFFDEADILFGKRSNVRGRYDRHVNTELTYLLQRIKEYQGIVIISTNEKKVIERTLLKFFRHIVDFSNEKK